VERDCHSTFLLYLLYKSEALQGLGCGGNGLGFLILGRSR